MYVINLFINILMWAFFVGTLIPFYFVALAFRLLTHFFDPNLKIMQQFTCFWGSLYLWCNPYWSLKIEGKENYDPKKTYVITANHQSMVDILVLFATFTHFKWISKAVMFRAPFLGWNMSLNGYVSINRGDPNSREKAMERSKNWLRRGSSMLFFPEGTRSPTGEMKDFKIGAFQLAIEEQKDILPIVIEGTRNALPKHSILLSRRSRMKIRILPAIWAQNVSGEGVKIKAQSLLDNTRKQMMTALAELRS